MNNSTCITLESPGIVNETGLPDFADMPFFRIKYQPAMDHCPVELWSKIARLACTDGGRTGCSLSLVSQYIRDATASARYTSVAITNRASVQAFANLATTVEAFNPVIRHLLVILEPEEKEHEADTATDALKIILGLASRTLYTLHCHYGDPFRSSPFQKHTIWRFPFPVLTDLTLYTLESDWDVPSTNIFPSLNRLHLVEASDPVAIWNEIALRTPSVQVVRLSLVDAFVGEDLPRFLRVLLDTPAPDPRQFADQARRRAVRRANAHSVYTPGSSEEKWAVDVASRLPNVRHVRLAPVFQSGFGANVAGGHETMRQVESIAQCCAEGLGKGEIHILGSMDEYTRENAWKDWLDAVDGQGLWPSGECLEPDT